jgi:hypothetical protein
MIVRFIESLIDAIFAAGTAFKTGFGTTWKAPAKVVPNKSVFAEGKVLVTTELKIVGKDAEAIAKKIEDAAADAFDKVTSVLAPDAKKAEADVAADAPAVVTDVVADVVKVAKTIAYEFKPGA